MGGYFEPADDELLDIAQDVLKANGIPARLEMSISLPRHIKQGRQSAL